MIPFSKETKGMRIEKLIAAMALIVAAQTAFCASALKLAPPFTDGAVLQRGRPVPVWGSAEPGKTVIVDFAGASAKTMADKDGKWRVDLAALAASKTGRTLVFLHSSNYLSRKIC